MLDTLLSVKLFRGSVMKVKHLFQYFCNGWLVQRMVPLKLATFCYRVFLHL